MNLKRQIDLIRLAVVLALGIASLLIIASTIYGAVVDQPVWVGYPGPYPDPYPGRDPYPAYLPVAPSAPTVEVEYP